MFQSSKTPSSDNTHSPKTEPMERLLSLALETRAWIGKINPRFEAEFIEELQQTGCTELAYDAVESGEVGLNIDFGLGGDTSLCSLRICQADGINTETFIFKSNQQGQLAEIEVQTNRQTVANIYLDSETTSGIELAMVEHVSETLEKYNPDLAAALKNYS